MARTRAIGGRLRGARVYLSGPMDFVSSREEEMKYGWRNRVSQFLKSLGVTVFDPWYKPGVRWFESYGSESPKSQELIRKLWTYEAGAAGQRARARCAHLFWSTMHVDLRMVDTSDFVVAYCPTTIYSVGTVHEIVMAKLQRKPVLFVSPRIALDEKDALERYLEGDAQGMKLYRELQARVPTLPNPAGIPSAWYMTLLGGHSFFDGFGFEDFRRRFRWPAGPMDRAEKRTGVKRPLLPFLLALQHRHPTRYSPTRRREVPDDDWLLWNLEGEGAPPKRRGRAAGKRKGRRARR